MWIISLCLGIEYTSMPNAISCSLRWKRNISRWIIEISVNIVSSSLCHCLARMRGLGVSAFFNLILSLLAELSIALSGFHGTVFSLRTFQFHPSAMQTIFRYFASFGETFFFRGCEGSTFITVMIFSLDRGHFFTLF